LQTFRAIEVSFLQEIFLYSGCVKAISKKFESCFVPPPPEFGPAFPRQEFWTKLHARARRGVYAAIFGPSATGKSMAVAHAFDGWPGVVNIRLHDEPFEALRAGLGLTALKGMNGLSLLLN
jgi:hypothetical protein